VNIMDRLTTVIFISGLFSGLVLGLYFML
jgi:hypothetical protein